MTGRDLKRLRREELLELLIEQAKENERLQNQISDMRQKLDSRELSIQNAGSIAEASLHISGIFRTAQEAADLYLENVRRLSDEQTDMSEVLTRDAREKAEALLTETKETCDRMNQTARNNYKTILALLEKVQDACGSMSREMREDLAAHTNPAESA